MKPRKREINIFNMSLIDILCGALGAFAFMMLALFPFYLSSAPAAEHPPAADGETLRNRVEELRQDVARARVEGQKDVDVTRENARLKGALQEARQRLDARYQDASAGARAGLVIAEVLTTSAGSCEYQIHVGRAPAGTTLVSGPYRDSDGRVIGAALILVDPAPGEYELSYKLGRGSCSVSGQATATTGSRHQLASTRLSQPGEARPAAVLVVDRAGRITLR